MAAAVLLAAILVACVAPAQAHAATYIKKTEIVKRTVKTLAVNKTYSLKAKAGYKSAYKVVLKQPGKLTVKVSGMAVSSDMDILAWVPSKGRAYHLELLIDSVSASKRTYHLPAGTYWPTVLNRAYKADAFKVRAAFTDYADDFKEPMLGSNNSLKKAGAASMGKTYRSMLGANCLVSTDGVDCYRFAVSRDGAVTVKTSASASLRDNDYTVYDSSGQYVTSAKMGTAAMAPLKKGAYYLKFATAYGDGGGTYSFSIGYAPSGTAGDGGTSAEGLLKAVLQNKASFQSDEYGRNVTINQYLQSWNGAPGFNLQANNFAKVDLDGDGAPEAVLEMYVGNNQYPTSYEILRVQNGTVYGYYFPYRAFKSLKTDGSFESSGGASNWGFGTIDFSGSGYSTMINQSTYCRQVINVDGNEPTSYCVNGKNATEKEFWAAVSIQDSKPDATWYDFNDSNVERLFK